MIIAIILVFCLVTLGSLDSILSESFFEAGFLSSAVVPWFRPAGRRLWPWSWEVRTDSSGQGKESGGLTVGEATGKLQLLCKPVKIQPGFKCSDFSTVNPATGGQRNLIIF